MNSGHDERQEEVVAPERGRLRSATVADVLEVVERSPYPMAAIRLPETVMISANQAAADLFAMTTTDLAGRRASTLLYGADSVRADVALSALASGAIESYRARRRLATHAATQIWTLVRSLRVADRAIALWLSPPLGEPGSVDVIDEQLAAVSAVRWESLATIGHWNTRSERVPADDVFGILDRLPPRQREIIVALLQGQRTAAIAESMFVSKSTIRSHLAVMFKEFGVHSQAELLSLLRSHKSASTETGRA
jgi:DNA-binding NarL/FixJ family response regulator